MSEILQLRGARALSQFRLAKLLASLQKVAPGVRGVAAEYRHFVDCERAPGAAERAVLERLLGYGDAPEQARGIEVLVVPRLGTLSPWSSKATDIARNCGLSAVRRIERGTLFHIEGAAEPARIAPLLHDRMTETLLGSTGEAAKLFEQVTPRAQRSIPLGKLAEANQRLGLALTGEEIEYLAAAYRGIGRDPTDAELTIDRKSVV